MMAEDLRCQYIIYDGYVTAVHAHTVQYTYTIAIC